MFTVLAIMRHTGKRASVCGVHGQNEGERDQNDDKLDGYAGSCGEHVV